MPELQLPDVTLAYDDSGGYGESVVFLHARSGTRASWEPQLPAFLERGFRCVNYDRRGAGASSADASSDQPGYAVFDLHALVTHLQLQPFHLIGTAADGVVALDFAISHPTSVRSLVIADTIGGVQDAGHLEVQRRLRAPEIEALPIELRELSAGYRGTNPEGVRRWTEIANTTNWTEHIGSAQKRKNAISLGALAALPMPVLVICGEADLLTPPALMRLIAAPIRQHEFETISEAGHAAHWEQPARWNEIVLDFLERN
jgi:pimeloyl-ACP methyl ester carboxylesterase